MLSLIMRQQPKLNVRACTLVVVPSRGVSDNTRQRMNARVSECIYGYH